MLTIAGFIVVMMMMSALAIIHAVAMIMVAVIIIVIIVAGAQSGFFSGMLGFLGEERFAVFARDLIIVGMDFRKGEEAVTVSAVFDKCGLQRGLDPRHFRQIDVSPERLFIGGFEIEFFDSVTS